MHAARRGHTAVRLADGRVLVLQPGARPDAELYHPRTGRWTVTHGMTTFRSGYSETLLPNGRVLVAGGRDAEYFPTASAELYDPRTGRWSATGSMFHARAGHTATLLPNGLVLVAGGCCTDLTIDSFPTDSLNTAELYNPRTGSWSLAPHMATARAGAVAVLLTSGRVLVAGGGTGPSGSTSAELYTPGPRPRIALSLSSLDFGNQRVGTTSHARTIAVTNISTATVRIETIDVEGNPHDFPVAGSCAGTMLAPRATCAIVLRFSPLAHGARHGSLSIYDVGAGTAESTSYGLAGFGTAPRTWAPTSRMVVPRVGHTATLLPDGRVLVVGGHDTNQTLASAELYDPRVGQWTATGSMSTAREYHTATLLPNGKVLVAGGCTALLDFCGLGHAGLTSSADLYDPQIGRWTRTGRMSAARLFQTATLLPNGKVLVAGGCGDPDCNSALASAELYDPANGTWSTTGRMSVPRGEHSATLLLDGKVLVSGGRNPSVLNSAELYDPVTGRWTGTGAMARPRYSFTATLLPTGKVLAAGGGNNDSALATAEIYDPVAGTWTVTGSMSSARGDDTATLLPDGSVLVEGGATTCGICTIDAAEVYAPSSGSWAVTDSMHVPRANYTATLLPDGTVLVAGGQLSGGDATPTSELYMTR
jgi:N-acetylneuraminic acid mutarotase